jgi:hypothetical protein
MPSATPLPPGPSRLALFGAEDLLRPDGCPVCRYVAEAGDRFLGWFALEAHADADMITRLCRSLGFCPVHTRGMLGQPGAGGRMTAVYIYLLRAAARYLAEGTSPPAPCLGCARDAEATQRALDTLLAGLRKPELCDRYRDSHGLCLPHLRAAAARGGRRLAAWLAEDTLARLAATPPGLAMLAGDPDTDAAVRARLRTSLPAICAACHTGLHLERDAVAHWAATAGLAPAGPPAGLCRAHLGDACSGPAAARLLAAETERSLAWLAASASPPGALGKLATRRRGRAGQPAGGCPVCRAAGAPADQALQALPTASPGTPPELCLRHVLALRRRDPRSAEAAVRSASRRTQAVLGELEEAFRKRSWAHRNEPRGREMTAWQRAAALVDGRVYDFGPPACPGTRHGAAARSPATSCGSAAAHTAGRKKRS